MQVDDDNSNTFVINFDSGAYIFQCDDSSMCSQWVNTIVEKVRGCPCKVCTARIPHSHSCTQTHHASPTAAALIGCCRWACGRASHRTPTAQRPQHRPASTTRFPSRSESARTHMRCVCDLAGRLTLSRLVSPLLLMHQSSKAHTSIHTHTHSPSNLSLAY